MGYTDSFSIGFAILSILFWPIIIIGAIIFFVTRARNRRNGVVIPHPHLMKEEIVSQLFYVLGLFFLGTFLAALNRDLGHVLSLWWLTLLTALVAAVGAYYLKSVYLLPIGIVGLMSWWAGKAGDWIANPENVLGYVPPTSVTLPDYSSISIVLPYVKPVTLLTGLCLIALSMYAFSYIHRQQKRWQRFAFVHQMIGLLFITCVLFFLSTEGGLQALESMTQGGNMFRLWPIGLSLVVFASTCFVSLGYALQYRLIHRYEAFMVGFLALTFIVLCFTQPLNLVTSSYSATASSLPRGGVWWAIFLNILVFVEVVGIIFSGYWQKQSWLINLGTLLLFLLVAIKYFDWFFSFLNKSLFFISAGIFLLVIGLLMEKGRRRVIAAMGENNTL